MKIIKFLKRVMVIAIFALPFSLLTSNTANANPWKIVWQLCAPGSEVNMVIRCRLDGGEECFANWQGHCDEAPGMGD